MSKLKPFNLEKALAGDPVVTEDGRPARYVLTVNNKIAGAWHIFIATEIIVGTGEESEFSISVRNDGKAVEIEAAEFKQSSQSGSNLFMAPQKKTVYVNIWKSAIGKLCCSDPMDSKEQCLSDNGYFISANDKDYIDTYPVEIEL